MAGGAALSAAVALGEFGASTFVVRGDAPTLPTLVGRLLSRQAPEAGAPVSYTHLRAPQTVLDLVCRPPLEKKKPRTETLTICVTNPNSHKTRT